MSVKNKGLIIIIILSLAGFIITNYMTYNHFLFKENPQHQSGCKWLSKTKDDKCREVALSKYSEVFKIPISFLGIYFFLAIFILAIIYLFSPEILSGFPNLITLISGFGVLVYLYLTYLEAFIIRVFCPLCVITSLITLFVFIVSLRRY